MMRRVSKVRFVVFSIVTILAFCAASAARAQTPDATKPFLHPLFTNNMVLQRDVAAPVWGWTAPGKQVKVTLSGGTLNGRSVTGTADKEGKWMVRVGPFPAGGPYTLRVEGVGQGAPSVTRANVLMGDVWVASGQSNMQWGMNWINAPEEVANATHPQMRLFTVPNTVAAQPQSLITGEWRETTPATVARGELGGFSAVSYFFGRELQQNLNVPIGLLVSAWNGTVAESWVSKEALGAMPEFQPAIDGLEQFGTAIVQADATFDTALQAWWQQNDAGVKEGSNWAAPAPALAAADVADWKPFALPQAGEATPLPHYGGVVWFRKEFDLPAAAVGKELLLNLGPVATTETTWVNGVQVGTTDIYPLDGGLIKGFRVNGVRMGGVPSWQTARVYRVPANALKAGRNVIAVRVLDPTDAPLDYSGALTIGLDLGNPAKGGAPTGTVKPLDGAWQYRIGAAADVLASLPGRPAQNPNNPIVLSNSMIAPLSPFAIKGAIWYQGESNADRPAQYKTLLPIMIKDWRAKFGVGDFPFYIVQLANFHATEAQPTDTPWTRLREAQLQTAQTVPNTGLAVTIDIGDPGDIHPRNKKEVGRRLALSALAQTYKQEIEYSGPSYKAIEVQGPRVLISFDHARGLNVKGDGAVNGFAIAGADKKFVWAEGMLAGESVILSSPEVANPVYVRYAWADNPNVNLYNEAGLPAVPFRTDTD
jgi:sialate O-acetylesterase